MTTASSPESVLLRYEVEWSDIAERNADICKRARSLAANIKDANARCESAAAGWSQLRGELAHMGSSSTLMEGVARRIDDVCSRIDQLEARLHDATLARMESREQRWRQQQKAKMDTRQQLLKEELLVKAQQQARQEEERRAAEQVQQERDRQRTFQEQYEAQRDYLRMHGDLEKLALSRGALQPPAPLVAPANTLADVAPKPSDADAAALDDFYADD